MKFLKTISMILMIILFTACVGGKVYVHSNYSPQRFAYDKAVCNNFARGSYGNIPYQNIPSYDNKYNVSGYVNNQYYSGTITQQPTMQQSMNNIAMSVANIVHQNRLEEAFDACMFQKGWTLQNNNIRPIFDEDGFDGSGYNKQGLDRDGFYVNGFNKYNINKYTNTKYDKNGYDVNGYDRDGYNINGYDSDGYDKNGLNTLKYTKDGFNEDGYDRDGYDRDGYDFDGYNRDGYDRNNVHMSEKFKLNG